MELLRVWKVFLISGWLMLGVTAFSAYADGPDPFIWGVVGHPAIREYLDLGPAAQLDLVQELGCNAYRVDVRDTAHPYDRSAGEIHIDEMLPLAAARGIKLLPILFRPLDIWDAKQSPEDIYQASYNRGKAFAEKYRGKFDCIEIENEMDDKCIIRKTDGKSTADYDDAFPSQKFSRCIEVVRGLADGVRAGDPDVKRAVGTCGWYHYGFIDELLARGGSFEILVVHWYSNSGSITRAMQGWSRYGKPIWLTEMDRHEGSFDNAEEDQAKMVSLQAEEMRNLPGIDAIFVYELLDEPHLGPSNPESYYGLCSIKGGSSAAVSVASKKKAFTSYQEAIRRPANASPGDIVVDATYLAPAVVMENASIRFSPWLPTAGNYVVSVRFASSVPVATSASIKVNHIGEPTHVLIRKGDSEGDWVVVGTYPFNAGEAGDAGSIELDNVKAGEGKTIDAVKFNKH